MQIDIRGNSFLDCPDPEIVSRMVQVACDGADPGIGGAAATTLRGVALDDNANTLFMAPTRTEQVGGDSDSASTLGVGAIAGIVVAVVVVALIAVAVATVALRRYKEGKRDAWTAATLDDGQQSTAGMDYTGSSLP